MKIRYNKSASTATRYLGNNRNALAKSLEKLASGYAVNRAADDAAGLAISEKMRWQITGLDRAYKNSKEGSKLIQTGEGALDEIHDMLNRAASLANQSSNGTYDDEIDRQALQDELDQLCADIERIAKSANFNGVKLFQDKGLEFEGEAGYGAAVKKAVRQTAAAVENAKAAGSAQSSSAPRTLDDLLEDQETGSLNIVYVEQSNAQVTATTTGTGSSTLGRDKEITITNEDGSTTTKKLSDILKTEIVPNTVKQVLDNYPAFGYLTGSTIGIGLEYYTKSSNPNMASALAYVTIGYAKTPDLNYANYTLGVNIDTLPASMTREDLAELEATIAHEMIHAFMDEATTAGMIGFDPTSNSFNDAAKFPTWFVEGMAQTASGPGNWVHPNSGSGLRISKDTEDSMIQYYIGQNKLGTKVGGSGDYGTGYLACMYLGWAISAGGNASTPVTAENISMGLTSLMNEVIGGKSLDKAISELTGGKFTSTSDFQAKFNAADSEVTGFVHNLLVAKGDGRGGLVSGDLTAKDLVPDTADNSGTKLFELDTEHNAVKNVYPNDYPVLSGGTVSGDNTKVPGDFKPAVTEATYGDFVIKGNLPSDGNGGMEGIEWDDNTKTLTVKTGSNIEITMQSPTTGINGKLVLEGDGKVTLDGVKADGLTVSKDTQISYKGKNDIGTVTVDSGKTAAFQGEGQLKAGTFTNNGTVSFSGGAVIAGNGTGTIGGAVTIDNASVAASITSPKGPDAATELKSIAVDWSKLPSGFNIASISFDGAASGVLLGNGDSAKLWLDPAGSHRITFTDSNGVSKTLAAKLNASGQFEWAEPVKPFTVTGGTEGTDYHYEDDGTTLVIDTNAVTSISGGNAIDESGAPLQGRVKIKDGVGTVSLELNGVDCSQNTVGSGFDLGTGNTVTLTLKDGTENKFTGAANFAGISIGDNSDLTINGNTGKLTATGGTSSAGIGRSYSSADRSNSAPNANVTINGGEITANGGQSASAIGAGYQYGFGNITIAGGTVNANGGYGGSAIGAAYAASAGDIAVRGDAKVRAISNGHGAGIGGGWTSTGSCGAITIEGNADVYASSTEHGTGIGAGCSGSSGMITIKDNAKVEAIGGDSGAGIGSSWNGTTKTEGIQILGNSNVKATGGKEGAGIGAGNSGSKIGKILIDTTGTVTAEGGQNGVGIGSGSQGSSVEDIEIKQGTIKAKGGTDSTGIGAGRESTSGNITIGSDDPDKTVIVSAEGGMSHNGGNIMSYTDVDHKTAGTVTVIGSGTSVRPGTEGEGLYSTSGATDGDGNKRYAYPVYLFEADDANAELDAGVGLNAKDNTQLLPLDKDKVKPGSIKITSETGDSWTQGLSHEPLDSDYVFVWLKPENQKLTITYDEDDGAGNYISKTVELDLIYHANAGVFRIATQPKPPDAQKPEYQVPYPVYTPPTDPTKPTNPTKPIYNGQGGIILQIGAEYGETLTVPQFYLSLNALKMGNLDISTQTNAWESMPIIKDAINRVSSIRSTYGALFNRLEHNQNQLQQEVESVTDAESRIRDTDVAAEMIKYIKSNILNQSAQAMLAQANQIPQNALQMLS